MGLISQQTEISKKLPTFHTERKTQVPGNLSQGFMCWVQTPPSKAITELNFTCGMVPVDEFLVSS